MSFDHDIPAEVLAALAREAGEGTTPEEVRAFLNEKQPWAIQQVMRHVAAVYDLDSVTDEQIWKMIEEAEGGTP